MPIFPNPWELMAHVHPQAHHHRDGAGQVDEQIAFGVNHRLRAAAGEVEKRLVKEVKHRRQRRAQQQQEGKADAHDPGCLLPVPLPPGNGAQGRAAGAAQIGKGGDDVCDGHDQSDARKGIPPHGLDMADERPVHHIV